MSYYSIDANFTQAENKPERSVVAVRMVNFETTQNIDINLPANSQYQVDRIEVIPRTLPSAITTKPRLGFSKYDGTTASIIRGTAALHATTAVQADTVFAEPSPEGDYVYFQNIAAATDSALITQVAALNTPGAASVIAQPDVPRKLRLVLVDNAGANLAGTVTITGIDQEGNKIIEIITVVAGTVAYDTVNAFATISAVAHNFGVLGQVTVDTMDLGQDTSIALPCRNGEVIKLVSNGTEEAVGASDVPAGTFDPTTAPDGSKDFEVWYRATGVGPVIAGGNWLRLVVTAGTVTGEDFRDVLVHLTRW